GSRVIATDVMPWSNSRDGRSVPAEIHRILTWVEGRMRVRLDLNPRFDYGQIRPRVAVDGRNASFTGQRDEMVLASTLRLKPSKGGGLSSEFEMSRGDREAFVLSYGRLSPVRCRSTRLL